MFFFGNAYSQSYIRMIDTANTWYVWGGGITTNGIDARYTNEFRFIGDTIINGITYSKLYSNTHHTANYTTLDYFGSMREDTLQQKIYRVFGSEEVDYDFSLHKGDSVKLAGQPYPIKIDSIKSENFAGKTRRRFYITQYIHVGNSWSQWKEQWIEGIGVVVGIVSSGSGGSILGPIDQGNELLCFWQSGQMLYQNQTYLTCLVVATGINEEGLNENIKICPNPSNGIFYIQSSEENSSIQIINLIGEKIYSSQINSNKSEIDLSFQPSGVYFLQLITDPSTGSGGIARKKIVISR